MNQLIIIILIFGLLSCNGAKKEKKEIETQTLDLETLAHEGIRIDYQFNSDKPTFGDLFLIVGFENPDRPHNSREFEKLAELEFEQVDDYFGIKNNTDIGYEVKIWLFPIINEEEVYHNQGPFDAIRITYVVLSNEEKTAELFEKIFHSINSNLDVTPFFEGQQVENFEDIKKVIAKTIKYCREELEVEPGSHEALLLDW